MFFCAQKSFLVKFYETFLSFEEKEVQKHWKQTIGWDSTANGTVCVGKTVRLEQTLRIQPEYYYLHLYYCYYYCWGWWRCLECHRPVSYLASDLPAMGSNWKNFLTFCTGWRVVVLVCNRIVQTFSTAKVTKTTKKEHFSHCTTEVYSEWFQELFDQIDFSL